MRCILTIALLASAGCGASGAANSERAPVATAMVATPAGTLRAMDAAMSRADRAALITRSLEVEPGSVDLRIGQSVVLFQLVRVTARDAAGRVVPEFVPSLRIADPSLFERSGPSVTPVRTGTTRLEIRPMIFDTARVASEVSASVAITVRP